MKKDPSEKIKKIIFLFLLGVLLIPFVEYKTTLIKVKSLRGAIIFARDTSFSTDAWFSGGYQAQKEKYMNEAFGFRRTLVRLNNQIAFNLFNKARANGVIIGKNNYLYEESYINAYYGDDFIGTDTIFHQIQQLKFLNDTLSKLGKTLILVFAPGKGSFYPEFIPDKYKKAKKETNYECYVKLASDMGLNYIDFRKYFLENKNKSKYILYPKNGIHWSNYGACLVADSMIKYIEKIRNIKMPHLVWNSVDVENAKEDDCDIEEGMNLLFHLEREKMAYPRVQIESGKSKTKPSSLIIADSFYRILFSLGISKVFSDSQFWFYNKQIFTDSLKNYKAPKLVNIKDEISRHDIIIIMHTEPCLGDFGCGFIEQAYNAYKRPK